MSIAFTVFTKARGTMTKTIRRIADGKIHKDSSGCSFWNGTAERRVVPDMASLTHFINHELRPNQAIAIGVMKPGLRDKETVASRDKASGDAITRTVGDNFVYVPGQPALALLDCDDNGMPQAVKDVLARPGGFWDAVTLVVPTMAALSRMERASTSAGLYYDVDGVRETYDSPNLHCYVKTSDGTYNKTLLHALHVRLCNGGLGWPVIAYNGRLLFRSIVDVSVYSPERLIFEAPAILIPPLHQDPAKRLAQHFPGIDIDIRQACPPLEAWEEERYQRWQDSERARLADACARQYEVWFKEQGDRLAAETGKPREHFRKTLERQCAGILLPDVRLKFDRPVFADSTVGDILLDPARFEKATLADPQEGVTRCKAQILRMRDGHPLVHSFAHGEMNYQMCYDAALVRRILDGLPADQVAIRFQALERHIEATEAEREALAAHVVELAGKAPPAFVTEFNEKYMVVNEAGKVRIFAPIYDDLLQRWRIDRMTQSDLRFLHGNRLEQIGTKQNGKPLFGRPADAWLKHPEQRKFANGVIFDPSGKDRPGYYNLWRGFNVVPKPGDWSLLRDHIFKNICTSNVIIFSYLIKWCARMVRYPATPGLTYIVLRGQEGVGKGILGSILCHLFGQHGMQINHPAHLVGHFNDHLQDCVCLFLDDAKLGKEHEGVIAYLTTERTLVIEGKGQPVTRAANFLHIIMATNLDWAVPASLQARRPFVLDVSDEHRNDLTYFAAIMKQMQNGGYEAMLHDLLHEDLTDFEVRRPPDTEGLQTQKKHSLTTVQKWRVEVLQRGYVLKSKWGLSEKLHLWTEQVATELLFTSYLEYAKQHRDRSEPIMTRDALGRFIKPLAQKPDRPRPESIIGEERRDVPTEWGFRQAGALMMKRHMPGYFFGPLSVARGKCEATFNGLSWEWPDDGASPTDGLGATNGQGHPGQADRPGGEQDGLKYPPTNGKTEDDSPF